MINNRQNGRRRGRGGGGPRSPNQTPNIGNRQDNRSRGNAAQLHEKYKALARDAQMQGDRVQSEYWLQFADHYFRVLNESRARFEEQRPRRDEYSSDEDDDQDEGVSADGDDGDEDERDMREPSRDRQDRQPRAERNGRPERNERPDRNDRPERPRREYREERYAGDRGGGERFRPQRDEPRREAAESNEERISLEVLPPAISVVDGDAPAKTPRRRTRRPRDEGDEIAPAA